MAIIFREAAGTAVDGETLEAMMSEAEDARYEELRSRLLGGQAMKYGEMEELLASAKAKGDQDVVRALKNVVDDPPAGALDESAADDPTGAPLDSLAIALDGLKGRGDLAADDAWIEDSDKLVLTYENVGWYEGLDRWAEDPEDDVESDLAKIYDALLESGYGLRYSRSAVKAAIDDAAAEAASDPEGLRPKENRFGDWDYTATCNVYVPFEIVDGPADVLSEAEDGAGFEAGRELLAVLRGMSNNQIRDRCVKVVLLDRDGDLVNNGKYVKVKTYENDGTVIVEPDSDNGHNGYVRHFIEELVNAGVARLSDVKRIVIDDDRWGKYECCAVKNPGDIGLMMRRSEIDYKTDYAEFLSEAEGDGYAAKPPSRGVCEVADCAEIMRRLG